MGKTEEIEKMSIDLTIIAIVFTIILLLVFFSAVVLYLAFRIKETFKKETKKGTNIAKTAFLIGIIFLAGAILYFSANALSRIQDQQIQNLTSSPTPTTKPTTPTITPSPNPGHTPTSTPTDPTPQSTIPSPTPTPISNSIDFFVYPSTVTSGINNQVTVTFTIYNPTSTTLTNTVIQTNDLFQYFNVISSSSPVSGSTFNVGTVLSGTTTVTLQLTGKSQANTIITIDLLYTGMPIQQTTQLTIVRGK